MPLAKRGFSPQAMRAEKREVAGHSVLASAGITILKIAVGLTTGSLGILSEAAHSTLDLVAAIVTWVSVRVSDKPADAEHQYGHGKVESFSAFIETGLLLLTCVWIIYEAFQRLFVHAVEVEPSLWAFAVLLISMGVDAWRSRALGEIAVKYQSQALEADALHFSTDIWSSGVVVLGLGLVWAGQKFHLPWLRYADPVAALFVAGVVIWVSTRLAMRTIDALLDAAPRGVRVQIQDEVRKLRGVLEVERVRIRRSGNHYFADMTVAFERNMTFQRSAQMSVDVTEAVHRVLPDADVIVHSVPRAGRQENVFDRVRGVAAQNNFNVHDISVQELGGRLHVEQHLELDERLSLIAAHDLVTLLETEIREQVPEISSILTHIESEPATIEEGGSELRDEALEQKLKLEALAFPEIYDVHEVKIKRVREKLYLSCHCSMRDELPLARVHEVCTELEIRIKHMAPELFRVLIHPEPQTDNLR